MKKGKFGGLVRGTSTFCVAKMVSRRNRQKDSSFDEADLRVKHFSVDRTNMEHILSSVLSKEKVTAASPKFGEWAAPILVPASQKEW